MYKAYSTYLKEKYGEKVYKLSISLPETNCPNRDGTVAFGGCIYCGEEGTGFENEDSTLSVQEQLYKHRVLIEKKYKAKKFIAYFQSFSNTYLPIDLFEKYINDAVIEDIVDISVSTRPDCISSKYLDILKNVKDKHKIDITIELGLQTANYKTLKKINRGHTLAEYIKACHVVKSYGFNICTHIILNFPYDDIEDVIETSKIVSLLDVDFIKLHALYIEKNTVLANQYLKGEFKPLPVSDYIERAITFIEYLNPTIAIARIIGRVPEEVSLFANWGISWWKIKDDIEKKMELEGRYQGRLFDYGIDRGLKKFD